MTLPHAPDWRDIGDVPYSVIEPMLRERRSPMVNTARATHEAAQPHSALFWAQAAFENQWQTTGIILGPEDHNPVALRPEYEDDTGPYGAYVITAPDGNQFLGFTTDADCAREWKRRITSPTYKGTGPYTTTTTLESYLRVYAPAKDRHPVTGVANADAEYLATVHNVLARFAAMEDTGMAGHTITWPGLPGGPITFSFPVSTAYLVPAWRTYQRPGIKARWPRRSVQHSNGNPSALARQDTVYLYGGAGGRQASWHGTVDHKEGYVNLPADEVAWQAGDGAGPGNYNGFSVELSEYPRYNLSAAQHRQARKNAAEMMGRVAARLTIADPDYHADFMNKNCPRVLRENATWVREYEADWWAFYNDEKARMTGKPSTPTARLKVGDHFEITADAVNIRRGWGTSARLVSTLLKGTKGAVIDGPESANGYTWWDVRIDGFGTGWIAEGTSAEAWLTKTTAPAPPPKPDPKPEYAAKSPVPELLETNMKFEDLYNTSAGVTTINELDFIFVADVIEFKRTSPALQYGVTGSKEVGPPYQEGDRVIAAWLVKGTDGLYYYLLTGGDDEWVRVKYIDTVRVADAPLIPMPNETHMTEALITTLEDALD